MTTSYLLDTNVASDVIRGASARARERLIALPPHAVALSAVSQGELIYGLRKKGSPVALSGLIRAFLESMKVLPWTAEVADAYGSLCASCAARGVSLGALNMMIAAHAVATGSVLVTRDLAFRHLAPHLIVQDWTI